MQALFGYDLTGVDIHEALASRLAEEPIEAQATSYADHLVTGVVANLPAIDDTLQRAAPAWRLDHMAGVDKAILRLALFELIVDNKTPLRAVINEAVELAKAYGGEHSGRFVNGVLGTVASRLHATPTPQHGIQEEA